MKSVGKPGVLNRVGGLPSAGLYCQRLSTPNQSTPFVSACTASAPPVGNDSPFSPVGLKNSRPSKRDSPTDVFSQIIWSDVIRTRPIRSVGSPSSTLNFVQRPFLNGARRNLR